LITEPSGAELPVAVTVPTFRPAAASTAIACDSVIPIMFGTVVNRAPG
jgi:hypothetical protein